MHPPLWTSLLVTMHDDIEKAFIDLSRLHKFDVRPTEKSLASLS